MPTPAPTSPQLAVYAKLLCLLMVVICGAAVPMEEKVRLFNERTKGFIEVSKRGAFVSARNVDVNVSKFTNLTIRSTNEIGVVELVFADLRPQRRLCMDKDGKLKGVKKLSKRRPPGCLFRECVDGGYFFYLTSHARPRLLGFNRGEQFNPLGPRHCCSQERRFDCSPAGCVETAEHLVPDGRGHYTCARRPARHDVDYFFFLKKRQENASLADTIPVHNHMRGGHSPEEVARLLPESHHHRGTSEQQKQQHRRSKRPNRPRPERQQQRLEQQRPHRTRHHHHLQELPVREPRLGVRVRNKKQHQDAAGNHLLLPWD